MPLIGTMKNDQRIDYDATKKTLYEFRLQASDSSSKTTATTVKVTVEDINDNAPIITPSFKPITLAANARGQVFKFSASDLDSDINKQFRFDLVLIPISFLEVAMNFQFFGGSREL